MIHELLRKLFPWFIGLELGIILGIIIPAVFR